MSGQLKLDDVWEMLKPLDIYYPDIRNWFYTKVIPGLDNHTRTILTEYDNDDLIGLSILKHDAVEKKICTLVVREGYRRHGVGSKLLAQGVSVLGYGTYITINKRLFNAYNNLLTDFGFVLVSNDIATSDTTELFYELLN